MTEEEVCRLAREFVERLKLAVSQITAVRRIQFEHPEKGWRDLWVVCFPRAIPLPVAEYPAEVIVEVEDSTGKATLFGSSELSEEGGGSLIL